MAQVRPKPVMRETITQRLMSAAEEPTSFPSPRAARAPSPASRTRCVGVAGAVSGPKPQGGRGRARFGFGARAVRALEGDGLRGGPLPVAAAQAFRGGAGEVGKRRLGGERVGCAGAVGAGMGATHVDACGFTWGGQRFGPGRVACDDGPGGTARTVGNDGFGYGCDNDGTVDAGVAAAHEQLGRAAGVDRTGVAGMGAILSHSA